MSKKNKKNKTAKVEKKLHDLKDLAGTIIDGEESTEKTVKRDAILDKLPTKLPVEEDAWADW